MICTIEACKCVSGLSVDVHLSSLYHTHYMFQHNWPSSCVQISLRSRSLQGNCFCRVLFRFVQRIHARVWFLLFLAVEFSLIPVAYHQALTSNNIRDILTPELG
jgi:hypothetical protein